MDPLSDVLSLLKPHTYMSAALEAGGSWSIQFPDQAKGIKTGAVVAGRCWVEVSGEPDPIEIRAGDFFMLPSGRPFRIATDLALEPVDAADAFAGRRSGGIVHLNEGNDFALVSNRFALGGPHADLLLGMLPPVVLIRDAPDQTALRWSVERMMQELRTQQPGAFLVIEHLAHIMLVEALRLHLSVGTRGGVGWLFALADRQIGAAIRAMHADPAHSWTIRELAERVGMSRSTFALRFRETAGAAPMDYLTRWRMLLAGNRLTNSEDSISAIALSLGYESESAFSTAFKRVMNCSPRHYARDRKRLVG